MPFSSGVASASVNFSTDAATPPIPIGDLDSCLGDICTMLSNCILRDGTGSPVAAVPFNGQDITGGGDFYATSFRPSGSVIPTNGLYLPAANTPAIASNTLKRWSVNSTGNHVFTAPASGVAATFNANNTQSIATFFNNEAATAYAGISFGSAAIAISAGVFGQALTGTTGGLSLQYVFGSALTEGIFINGAGQVTIRTPSTTVTALTVNTSNTQAVAKFFNNEASTAYAGITFGSTAITVSAGVFGQALTASTGGLSLQYVTGSALTEGVFINSSGEVLVRGKLSCNNVAAPAQVTGWGSPVNPAVINNYNITDAGGANSNTNKAVAQIIKDLKAFGLYAA